jgi:hypothetical protein
VCVVVVRNSKRLMGEAEKKRAKLQKIQRQYPQDPILNVTYSTPALLNRTESGRIIKPSSRAIGNA